MTERQATYSDSLRQYHTCVGRQGISRYDICSTDNITRMEGFFLHLDYGMIVKTYQKTYN